MFYFLYGTDTHKARQKLHELLDLAKKKRPEAELFKITTENWTENQFEELLVSQGLFEQKYTVVLDNVFENKESKSFILERLEKMQNSEQIFLILEGSVDSATLKKIESYAEKVQVFTKPEKQKESPKVFTITNNLLRKDKKGLWISYIDLITTGIPAEEIHGVLFWQVKNMILASRAQSQIETGLAPFPYKNALTGARNFKESELGEMSSALVNMTHRVRQGDGELAIMLEKWILSL